MKEYPYVGRCTQYGHKELMVRFSSYRVGTVIKGSNGKYIVGYESTTWNLHIFDKVQIKKIIGGELITNGF